MRSILMFWKMCALEASIGRVFGGARALGVCLVGDKGGLLYLLFFLMSASSLFQLTHADQYYLANLEEQELSRLQPEDATSTSWTFKTELGSYVWESCDVGKGERQDWLSTDWLKSVSHENLKRYLKISYVYWCENLAGSVATDSSCVDESIEIQLTSVFASSEDNQQQAESSQSISLNLRAHHYYDPSSATPPTYRVQMMKLPVMEPQTSKFRLAISAGKFCLRIFSIQITHPICPEVTKNLANFPVTFVADSGSVGMQTVFGSCVSNAGLPPGTRYGSSQDCSSDGVWMNDAPACQCQSGFEPSPDMRTCSACEPGKYKSAMSNRPCRECPTNSDSRTMASTSCECLSGFYRNADEPQSLPCGTTPSEPRSLKVSATNVEETNGEVTKLLWSAPFDYGHRSKVSYRIVCVVGCSQNTVSPEGPFVSNVTHVSVPVNPDTLYRFKVYSLNSLSGFYSFDALRFAEIEFRTAKKYIVRGLQVSQLSVNELKLEWEKPVGYPGSKYCIRFSRRPSGFSQPSTSVEFAAVQPQTKFEITCTEHSSDHPEIILSHMQQGTYQFAVRTDLDGNPGPFSEQVGIQIPESAMQQMGLRHVGLVVGIMLTVCLLFIILCTGMTLLYKRRQSHASSAFHMMAPFHKYEHTPIPTHSIMNTHHGLVSSSSHPSHMNYSTVTLQQQKLPVGQMFTEPSFFDDTDQILSELTCELDERYLQLSSEGTPQEQGALFQGTLYNPAHKEHTRVAVKALYLTSNGPNGCNGELVRRFAIEAALMAQFQHVNVSAFFGIVYSNCMWMLVTEMAGKGPLFRVLQEGAASGTLSFPSQLLMLKGLAAGMHYLADFGYVHKVLTSGNVVISDRNVPKICGFDMRAMLDESVAMSKTYNEFLEYLAPWQAPEVFSCGSAAKYSTASDVWSYGVVAWEIMSQGHEPYGSMNSQQISEFICNGQRLPQPKNCPPVLFKLISDCWNDNRNLRPWFVQINETVSSLLRMYPGSDLQLKQQASQLVDTSSDYYMTLQKASNTLKGVSADSISRSQCPSPAGTDASGPQKPASPVAIKDWLKQISMSQYSEKFEQKGFSELKDILDLQDAELKSMGITSSKNRKKLLANMALAKIKERKRSAQSSLGNQLNSIL